MSPRRKTPAPAHTSQPPVLAAPRYRPAVAGGIVALALLAIGIWFARRAHPDNSASAQATSDYVDPAICASCHDDIAATYRKTGMGRSFYRPTAANAIEDYSRNNRLNHKLSGNAYTLIQRDGKFFQRRNTVNFDGKETNVVEQQVDYVIGSGNHARTYLHRTAQGQLVELPVSWYTEKSGYWAMSPGYDQPHREDIQRTVTPECLFCHNGYPATDPAQAHTQEQLASFPEKLPEGVDCQRCHGPGRAHVDVARASSPSPQQLRASIVNPARLPRDRQMEVCMQCHLETSSRHLPNEIRAYSRSVSSYRPGQPLGDYKTYFDQEKNAAGDPFEVAHAAYRLRQSKCFLKSDMTCLTCHDPHNIPRGTEAIQGYIAACQQCHQTVKHRVSLPAASNCISCHMPKRRTDDVVHVVMTDHFIRSDQPRRDLTAPLNEKIEPQRVGRVVAYYPPTSPNNSGAPLYLAVAQVEADSDPQSPERLKLLLTNAPQAAAGPYLALGRAYVRHGDNKNAILWLDAAIQHEPDSYPAYLELASVLLASAQDARALDVLRRGLTHFPTDDQLLTNLGNVYLRMNMLAEAQDALSRAATANPERSDTFNLLGLAALRTNDQAAAEKFFREAIRWQPNLAEAQSNLATLLTGKHEFPEAEFHFAKAIEVNPDNAEAHHGLGLMLILTRSLLRATAELQEAVRLQPAISQSRNDLADLLAVQGETSQAAEQYKQVLQIDPGQLEAHLGLGLSLIRENKFEEARLHLERAANSRNPDVSQAASQALSQIAR